MLIDIRVWVGGMRMLWLIWQVLLRGIARFRSPVIRLILLLARTEVRSVLGVVDRLVCGLALGRFKLPRGSLVGIVEGFVHRRGCRRGVGGRGRVICGMASLILLRGGLLGVGLANWMVRRMRFPQKID